MQCEMCGSESQIIRAVIEGSEMDVCRNCAKFGRVISRPVVREVKKEIKKPKLPDKEVLQVVVPGFGRIIREKREKMGLKQEQLAKIISEKESVIHKIESEKTEPSIALARKLEKFLKIQLIEQHEEVHKKLTGTQGTGFTIGDVINLKK